MAKLIIYLLFGKESNTMIAMLWAQKIILGKKTFSQVPRLLKDQVREILIECGCEVLIDEGEV